MLEVIREWLNGSREYFKGVAIYARAGNDADLLEVMKKGKNDYRDKRLQVELLAICNELKGNKNYGQESRQQSGQKSRQNFPILSNLTTNQDKPHYRNEHIIEPVNQELYNACKLEADHEYKKVMNARAILFNLANTAEFIDPNTPDLISQREKLAIEVVTSYQKTSELYDKANFVKVKGHLPHDDDLAEVSEFDNLPDHLVKQQLDNARKSYNKLKNKEQTPERVALLQKHQSNLQKLETKWHSLQPK
jgi:hypothetical protein